MMTDNAIVILQTKSQAIGYESEYRIAYIEDVYKLYGTYDYIEEEYIYPYKLIGNAFSQRLAYNSYDTALKIAEGMKPQLPVESTKYGIIVLDNFANLTYNEICSL